MYREDEITADECGHLARILVDARHVRKRHHFFSWVQGPVQSLIPHEILLCGISDESGYLLHERFSACRYFRDEHFQHTSQPRQGLIAQLAETWCASGAPYLLQPEAGGEWHQRLIDLELKNAAFHGMNWINGRLKGYVSFSRVRAPFDDRLALYIEILQPHLLATLARVLAQEVRERGGLKPAACTVSAREIEVLEWVREGKTNGEIASILGLSALTVKNHLRHAMKKLDVRARSQAVAKAIALGLLRAQDTGDGGQ